MAYKTSRYRKISLNVARDVYDNLHTLSALSGISSVSELIRRGISLFGYVLEAQQRGETLAVLDKDGKVLREVAFL